jgi:hypothetical protein
VEAACSHVVLRDLLVDFVEVVADRTRGECVLIQVADYDLIVWVIREEVYLERESREDEVCLDALHVTRNAYVPLATRLSRVIDFFSKKISIKLIS